MQAGGLNVFFEEVAMPELEHQQTPYSSRHGPAAEKMIVHQFSNAVGGEIAAIERARFEQNHQHVFKFVAHPVDERQRESLLLPIQHFARHTDALRQLSENIFLLVAAQLPF